MKRSSTIDDPNSSSYLYPNYPARLPLPIPVMFAPTHETKPASRFARSVSIVGHFPLFSRYEVDYNNMESTVHHACLQRLTRKQAFVGTEFAPFSAVSASGLRIAGEFVP
jgi:hypothetical protein